MGATLNITRVGSNVLRFMLHEAHQTAVLEARTQLSPALRNVIEESYEQYAECVKGSHHDEPEFRELGMAFYERLLPPFIKTQLRTRAEPLTILTNDPSLPWEIMHDGTEFLALKMPLTRVLVISDQLGGFLRMVPTAPATKEFSALIISDPTDDLPGAREEGKALRTLFKERGHCDFLQGKDATYQSISTRLVSRAYSTIHLCGHVDFDARGRLSSIPLQNGSISAEDVRTLFKGSPLVFLNACYSGKASLANPKLASAQIANFAEAFMFGNENGVACSVVGTMWRIPDQPKYASKTLVLAFYEQLLAGGAVGAAMQSMRLQAREKKWGPMVWGPYVLYGDPATAPFQDNDTAVSKQPSTESAETKTSKRKTGRKKVPPPLASPPSATIQQDELGTEAEETPPRRKKEDANPLDTAARLVFKVAVREMMQLEQGALSSMHMLIGFCEAGVEPLKQLLAEKQIDPATISEQARRRTRELIPSQDEGFGVSSNVEQMLEHAARRASLSGHDKVAAEDLLAALLGCEDAEAIVILARAGLPPHEVLARLPKLPQIALEWFDGPTQEAMQHAIGAARQAHLDFLATPHLLLGLLRTGGLLTIKLLRERSISVEQLSGLLLALVGQGEAKNGNGAGKQGLFLHPRAETILQRAKEMAQRNASAKIGEEQLLQCLLEQQNSSTNELLRKLGADPKVLLTTLKRMKGEGAE